MAIGDHKDCDQSFLCVDKKILMEVPTEDIMVYLVAVYYVFNICYPTGTNNVYSFMEAAVLGLSEPSISITQSVRSFITRLDNL